MILFPAPVPQKRIYKFDVIVSEIYALHMLDDRKMKYGVCNFHLWRLEIIGAVTLFCSQLPSRLSAHLEQVEAEELLTSIRRCLDMLKVEQGHDISLLVIAIKPETNATSLRVVLFFPRLRLDADALGCRCVRHWWEALWQKLEGINAHRRWLEMPGNGLITRVVGTCRGTVALWWLKSKDLQQLSGKDPPKDRFLVVPAVKFQNPLFTP